MNLVDVGLQATIGLAAVAILAATVLRGRARNVLAGLAVAGSGLAAATTGLAALTGLAGTGLWLPVALPGVAVDPLVLAPDRLGGFFMLLAGLVIALAAIFGIGYAHGAAASRTGWTGFALFAIGVELVPAAQDVLSFALAWELMALGSTVLLLADHASRAAVREATLWYAVMTQLSFLLLLAGFGVLVAADGGTSFARVVGIGEPVASLAFGLLVAGFATKAGLVPVHVWLPRAHPEAPSHASAAMSAAMVKMGVYGILLVTLRLLPYGPSWWALVLVFIGAISALYGILQASVQSDLKRLLAYSTTENVGLIVTAIGAGLMLRQAGQNAVADIALVAALLLAISHAAFKTVLFLGAGAVLHATGERDLDALGGLASRMPITSLTFGVGALGAAALPVTSGFVAEWVLLQALIHADARSDRLLAVVIPITMGVVALTIGLGLLTFVKASGVGFLARPRTPQAAAAREVGFTERLAMLAAAGLTIGLGLIPGPLSQLLAGAVGARGLATSGWTGLELAGLDAVMLDPVALTALTTVMLAGVLVVNGIAARRHPRREVDLAWGCGGERTSARMEYNATSYSEPLARVFGASLQTRRSVEISHPDDAPLLVSEMAFSQETVDLIEQKVYEPAARWTQRFGDLARRLQNGSIHRYLGFSFAALLLVLILVTR
ncbi:MAG: hydrogenase 4 subunit B [Actinobacteria bacterium HGW-Actinobacteria-2]|nr:MAG: hydrogenase 4 subunit B [Actinobacteria bacterium HGW-Actinobacteria-2]